MLISIRTSVWSGVAHLKQRIVSSLISQPPGLLRITPHLLRMKQRPCTAMLPIGPPPGSPVRPRRQRQRCPRDMDAVSLSTVTSRFRSVMICQYPVAETCLDRSMRPCNACKCTNIQQIHTLPSHKAHLHSVPLCNINPSNNHTSRPHTTPFHTLGFSHPIQSLNCSIFTNSALFLPSSVQFLLSAAKSQV